MIPIPILIINNDKLTVLQSIESILQSLIQKLKQGPKLTKQAHFKQKRAVST